MNKTFRMCVAASFLFAALPPCNLADRKMYDRKDRRPPVPKQHLSGPYFSVRHFSFDRLFLIQCVSHAASLAALGSWLCGAAGAAEVAPVDFARDIQPLFAEHCLSCHSGEEPAAGLNLGVRTSLLAEAESSAVPVVPGRPDASELLRRVTASDPGERMPPEGEEPLGSAAIAKLRNWITAGAAWGGHWSFQPLSDPTPPATRQTDWARNDLDRFVLARLESQGIRPAPEADRYTLVRRLHYDLLGLPPSIQEVDQFVEDGSSEAYEALVSRLLESPHFGERWGRHWLDLAHYADSDGYETDRVARTHTSIVIG